MSQSVNTEPASEAARERVAFIATRFAVLGTRAAGAPSSVADEAAPRLVLPPPNAHDLTHFEREGNRLRPVHEVAAGAAGVEILLPRDAASPFHLKDPVSGLEIDVTLASARPISVEVTSGYALYREALGARTDLIHRTGTEGKS